MKNKPTAADIHAPGKPAFRLTAVLCALLAASFAPMAGAGVTDLSNQPLATLPTVKAKPNLLFVMDTSGSMSWSYMPDDLGYYSNAVWDYVPHDTWYGYWSPQCNGVAYDPTSVYNPPQVGRHALSQCKLRRRLDRRLHRWQQYNQPGQ
ncbi:hypothetical protein ACQ858_22795 [Variovorax ureilyticus]|uniref:hypothetical protein n=1 Tax=Variovorax ureilyticus TaxID=1836198 RepID=UPI003D66EAF3